MYEMAQIKMNGPQDYFTDTGNLIDCAFIGCSIAMCVVNLEELSEDEGN